MKRKEIRDSVHIHEKINYLINFTDFPLYTIYFYMPFYMSKFHNISYLNYW